MNVMDLMAKISLDSSDFNKELGESKSNFASFGSAIASGAKTAGKMAVGAIATMGTAVAGASAAFIKGAGDTAAYADNIDKLSQKMGFSAEGFQEWDFIMKHNGSSIESVKGAMMKLDKALESDTDAWAKLGLSQEELLAMSPEDKFNATVMALQGVSDETEKAALAQDIFGKSYQEMMPLLNQSAEETAKMKQEVHDLGGVMSDEAVKAGADFTDSLQNMKTAISGAKNNLMGEFLPSLTTAMDGLTALFTGDTSGIAKIKEGISGLASKLNDLMPSVIETISGIAEALISALPDFVQTIADQLPSILDRLIPLLIDVIVKLADSLSQALPKVIEVINKNLPTITSGLTKVIMALGKMIVQLFPKIFPMLIKTGVQLITELAKGLTSNMSEIMAAIIECINVIIQELSNPETLTMLLQCGLELTLAIAKGLIENAPQLIASALELITNLIGWFIVDGAPMILGAAGEMFEKIGEGLLNAWDFVKKKIGELLGKVIGDDGIGGWIGDILGKAQEAFESIGEGISNAWETITSAVSEFGSKIWNGIKDGLGDLFQKGVDIVMDVIAGIKSVAGKIQDAIWGGGTDVNAMQKKAAEKAAAAGNAEAQAYVDGLKKGYDVNSPSRKTKWIGEMVMRGFTEGLTEEGEDSESDVRGIFSDINKSLSGSVLSDGIVVNGGRASGATKTETTLENIQSLLKYIAEHGMDFTLPVFIGYQQIDEQTVSSKNRIDLRSGGQVNV